MVARHGTALRSLRSAEPCRVMTLLSIGMTVVGKQPDVPFPVWPAIPLLISSSLLSATLLTKFIEEPTRRFFKPKSKTE